MCKNLAGNLHVVTDRIGREERDIATICNHAPIGAVGAAAGNVYAVAGRPDRIVRVVDELRGVIARRRVPL